MRTIQDLQQMQALPLNLKIRLTQERVRQWVNEFGEDGCYISFSGGKDSTVLVDIVDKMGYNIPLMFVDTGLEYPEIREFVKSYGDRVDWVKPKMNFKKVIEKYGYPFFSKEVADCVPRAKKYLTEVLNEVTLGQTDRQTGHKWWYQKYRQLVGIGEYQESARNVEGGGGTASGDSSKELASLLNERMQSRKGGANQRLAQLLGWLTKDNQIQENSPNRSQYAMTRYQFLLDAPFEIDSQCCKVMKKNPAHKYHRDTGRNPITAQMASESRVRTQKWLQTGCNGFNLQIPTSNPMSFWTEQDVLLYIKTYNIPMASVYGEIVEEGEMAGQLTWDDAPGYGIFDMPNKVLTTTGCKRTGCMFCGFGCQFSTDDRFVRMRQTHPQVYDYIMRPKDKGGLGYKEVIDWINEHSNFNIRY